MDKTFKASARAAGCTESKKVPKWADDFDLKRYGCYYVRKSLLPQSHNNNFSHFINSTSFICRPSIKNQKDESGLHWR